MSWFLPAGKPGSTDAWCFETAGSGAVQVFVDVPSYHKRLADLIAQTGKGDEILILGWDLNLGVLLKKNKSNPKKSKSARLFLTAARGRGAQVRLLATSDLTFNNDDGTTSSTQNAAEMAKARKLGLDGRVDHQLPASGMSFHQKAAYIRVKKKHYFFVGGMDIAPGREKWFDVQAEVQGVGAMLGRKSLMERWEGVVPPLGGVSATTRSLPTSKFNAFKVQVVRTYPPIPSTASGWTRKYAPKGDYTTWNLLFSAVKRAKKSIYIENQYFGATGAPHRKGGGATPKERSDFPAVKDTLERVLSEAITARNVKVVVVTIHRTTTPAAVAPPVSKSAPMELLRVPLAKYAAGYLLHSKTWIVDDEFVVVSSANYWRPSLLGAKAEAELGIGFTTDTDGSKLGFPGATFGRALRIKLWERLRRHYDASYVFPRNASSSFADELKELKSTIGGVTPFE